MKIIRLFTLSFLLALVACQGAPGQPTVLSRTPVSQRRKITIAWIPKALNNPVFEVGKAGAIQKAAELTAAGSVDVEVMYVGPVASDAAEQARVVDDVIARKVDAIAISCDDPTACIDPINRAVAARIPVMTWDADSPQSNRFTFLGLDNILAGKAGAQLLVNAMGTKGKVAILTGVPGNIAANLEAGGAGAITGNGSAFTRETSAIFTAFRSRGDVAAAQARLNERAKVMAGYDGIAAQKFALTRAGVPEMHCRPPLADLTAEQKKALLEKLGGS